MGLFQPGPAQAKANGSLFLVLAKARSEAELEQPDLPDTQCRGGTGETGSGGKEGRVVCRTTEMNDFFCQPQTFQQINIHPPT